MLRGDDCNHFPLLCFDYIFCCVVLALLVVKNKFNEVDMKIKKQSTNKVIMIRPHHFLYNVQTAQDNIYQNENTKNDEDSNLKAQIEFDNLTSLLKLKGIDVNIIEDTVDDKTPDSIFPNNWFSTENDTLIIYPMYTDNRKLEANKFILKVDDIVKKKNKVDLRTCDVLEGTGAMVLDRVNKVAYCSLSQRASKKTLDKFCKKLGYEKVVFSSYQNGKSIYHTNVMMTIGTDIAFLAFDLISEKDRNRVLKKLQETHKVILLSEEEVSNFAGNMLELDGENDRFLLMSSTAYNIFSKEKIKEIEKYIKIVHSDVSFIEKAGGGSVRCMIAEIF